MISVGEATMRLLARYGVDTIFGIPGVHTLEFYRGLAEGSAIRHVQARNELGAGFMADGYARSTGRPGVVLTISGPGVTNAATALGQSYADSVPLLMKSAETSSDSLGKGWGVLHEVTDLNAVTRPLTALSVCCRAAEDMPGHLAKAFEIFTSQRPRPVHISVPIDVLSMLVDEDWQAVTPPPRPQPEAAEIDKAAALLQGRKRPVILTGGGASEADVTRLAERLGAVVISSNAGKGIVPDGHALNLGGSICRPECQRVIERADAVLAIGTELSPTDSYIPKLPLHAPLVRIDIDPHKINDLYPADVGIVSDAKPAAVALLAALGKGNPASGAEQIVREIKQSIPPTLNPSEQQHLRLLTVIRESLPDDAIIMGDACQVSYSASFALPVQQPRRWHYAAGYCALGFAFPNAIGAKLAQPELSVIAIAGDGGSMFTIQELVTAAEQKLPIPYILWHNHGYKQIRDDMRDGNYPRVAVDGLAPDFTRLAEAMHCRTARPDSADRLAKDIKQALSSDGPTLIIVEEDSGWLRS